MNRFKNKNCLITGAASGIGKAAAIRIANEGGNLALIDIDEENLSKTAEEITKTGRKVVFRKCNVADFNETGKVINSLCKEIGGISSLSHNAGVLRCYNTHEMTHEQWSEIININLNGTFHVNRHSLPFLLKNPVSFIVNTSSIAANYRHPWASAYSATKGAIRSFTKSLFIEYFQQGLRANCILPGSVKTSLANSYNVPKGANPELLKSLTPFGKASWITPESVAASIAFLASEEAMHINGAEIVIDGGKV